jgi:putative ABC transport system permease protein
MNAIRPPRVAVWLLRRRLPRPWRDFVLGDLEEEFAGRASTSPSAARTWFWWQALRCLVAPPPVRRVPMPLDPTPGDSSMRTLVADLRYAVRVIRRTPSFAAAVIAVLAIGIGANTAIFSIVNTVLLRPLPIEDPEQLVAVLHTPPQSTFPGQATFALSPANFYDWQRASQSFEGMALYRTRRFTLTGTGDPRSVLAGAVGSGFFDIVRATPALGRVFTPEEDRAGAGRVAIVSDGFWTRELGRASDAIGRTLRLDGDSYTIVGVMPPQVTLPSWPILARDIWVPLALSDEQRAVRENHNMQGVARLKDGVSRASAQADLTVIAARLEREYPAANAGWGAILIPVRDTIVGDVRASLFILLGAVALVLLIACANVGNLLFTRALARRKEIAIRAALGAVRGRVFQQLLTEALVLAAAGGGLGLLIAVATLDAVSAQLATQVPRAEEISLDGRVLLFAAGAAILTGIIAGTLPALRAGRSDLTDALKEGGRSDGAIGIGTRRALIVCEVALSVVLLMGAAVMLQSLRALRSDDPGFDGSRVLTMSALLPAARYPDAARRTVFFDTALERLRALPGVEAAGTIDNLPFEGGSTQPIVPEGRSELLPHEQPTVQVRSISPGYLRSMGIPLLGGRDVVDSDVHVLLASRAAATMLWGQEDALGRRATLPLISRMQQRMVVGIVGDVKQGDLAEAPAPTVYLYTRERGARFETFVLRTSVPPETLSAAAMAVIRAIDPDQPVQNLRTMAEVRDGQLTSQRFSTLLLGAFAAVALLLASIGIYSVLSFIVRGRSREIGIRTALGARTGDVLRLVIREGMSPALAGIAAGAIASIALARVMDRVVFGVSASDPFTLVAVSATLTLVALMASVVPAYRASRVDPIQVLRTN